jgi:hypothetical protein
MGVSKKKWRWKSMKYGYYSDITGKKNYKATAAAKKIYMLKAKVL